MKQYEPAIADFNKTIEFGRVKWRVAYPFTVLISFFNLNRNKGYSVLIWVVFFCIKSNSKILYNLIGKLGFTSN